MHLYNLGPAQALALAPARAPTNPNLDPDQKVYIMNDFDFTLKITLIGTLILMIK